MARNSENRPNIEPLEESEQVFYRLCKDGSVTQVKQLLALPDIRAHLEEDVVDESPIIVASENGHTNIVELLLENGANVDQRNSSGITALMRTSQLNDHVDVVRLLLNKGAQVNIADFDTGWTALVMASKSGQTDIVSLLLDKGAQVDVADSAGWTALMISCEYGHTGVVKLLLDKGAQIDITETAGWTALMIASQYEDTDVVKVLLERGACINTAETDGWTALMIASENGHASVVTLHIEHGASVDHQSDEGWSALMIASNNGHTRVVQLLLDNGAKVNLQTKDGISALMAASWNGHRNVIKQLLDHGVETHLKDNLGKSALTMAPSTENLNILTKVNSEDSNMKELVHLNAIENAIRERGKLDHTLVHGVFVGPPRSGKDTLMKRLLGEMPTDTSPSTGVAENVVHVKVEKSATFAATVQKSNWARLTFDDEALYLMKKASSMSSRIRDVGETGLGETHQYLPSQDTPKFPSQQVTKGNKQQIENTSNRHGIKPQPVSIDEEEIVQIPRRQSPVPKHKSPMDIFKEAVKNKGLEGLKTHLEKSWSLYLTNTGGQMEFQELLPLLVSGPSIFFITFQLHKELRECFSVEYELPGRKSCKCYQSSLSILESILQTLSSISAMGTFVYKGLQKEMVPLKPKVFIIGTHKDLLDVKSVSTVITDIDICLQQVIKSTSHYSEGMIHFSSESQMIFAVNNLDPDDSDFHQIRYAVEKVVETGNYRMRSPAHWMIYSLVVRQLQNRVESYETCYAIANEYAIADREEFDEALHFIHTKMGLIRHFPHKELKEKVIVDPQILFEKVTELIVETFTFENIEKVNHSSLQIFKNRGIFNLNDFMRIGSQTGQNLTPTLFAKLLEYLRIAAPFQQDGITKYFLPCVLSHAPAKDSVLCSTLPKLLVTFQCGYCPKGLFGTLITYLITNEMQSRKLEWEFLTDQIYRNEVSFIVSPYDVITLRMLSTHLEITCSPSNPILKRKSNCSEEDVCKEVCQSIDKGIKTVTSAINYMNAQHSFTFYCTSGHCSEDPHPAKLKKFKGELHSLMCDKLKVKKAFPLPEKFEKWQLYSTRMTFELNEATSHSIKPEVKLDKHHHVVLFRQLSKHSSKWRMIGSYLGFLPEELNIIGAKPHLYYEGPKGFMNEMLSEWLEWAPGDQRGSTQYATLKALNIAMSDAGLGASVAELITAIKATCQVCEASISAFADVGSTRTPGQKRGRDQDSECKQNPKRQQLE